MKIVQKDILGSAILLKRELFTDDRGLFRKLFSFEEFTKHGVDFNVKQVNYVRNREIGTFRGLHFQKAPFEEAKIVLVLKGSIRDIITCVDESSKFFGKSYEVDISAENKLALYVPAKFAHGYITTSKDTEVLYLHDSEFDPASDSGISIFSNLSSKFSMLADIKLISEKDKKLKKVEKWK